MLIDQAIHFFFRLQVNASFTNVLLVKNILVDESSAKNFPIISKVLRTEIVTESKIKPKNVTKTNISLSLEMLSAILPNK